MKSDEELVRKNEQLQEELDRLRNERDRFPYWGDPTYNADYMRLWNRNSDFLLDPLFLRAYARGMQSDHRLAGAETVDIHIEYRIAVCCWAAWHCKQLPGDFVECGTNTGIMSLAICEYINLNSTSKSFYLFDTYSGIPTDQIRPTEGHAIKQNEVYRDCYEVARKNFEDFPNAILVKGRVPDTLVAVHIESICYLMLDMNITYPEISALEFFWDKIVPGGIVLFDDYGWLGYHEQKSAHDEFASARGLRIFNLPTGQGMLIKGPRNNAVV